MSAALVGPTVWAVCTNLVGLDGVGVSLHPGWANHSLAGLTNRQRLDQPARICLTAFARLFLNLPSPSTNSPEPETFYLLDLAVPIVPRLTVCEERDSSCLVRLSILHGITCLTLASPSAGPAALLPIFLPNESIKIQYFCRFAHARIVKVP